LRFIINFSTIFDFEFEIAQFLLQATELSTMVTERWTGVTDKVLVRKRFFFGIGIIIRYGSNVKNINDNSLRPKSIKIIVGKAKESI